jgi:hypothetical protein
MLGATLVLQDTASADDQLGVGTDLDNAFGCMFFIITLGSVGIFLVGGFYILLS